MSSHLGYVRPGNLDEALAFLGDHGHETTLIAGGTDVMVDLRAGALRTRCLMDVSALSELKGIGFQGNELRIGAGTTISEIYKSETLGRFAPALQKASFRFASQQIRNVATIGGNVAHCSPCADTVPPLIIHEARVVLASRKGERTLPVEDLAAGPYKSAIGREEILTKFLLRPVSGIFSDFQKIGRRKELAISRVSLALMAEKDAGGKMNFIRLALGSCTPTPGRIKDVENLLEGRVLNKDLLWEAAAVLSQKMIQISGLRPSTTYKEKAVQGLLVRMLYPMVLNEKGF
jgi:CO/xanthine dehydrogenase FAD-binding subunit